MKTRPAISRSLSGQRGLTLVEFMVAAVIGMLMIAAIATLIANQSTNRSEVDREGKMIENGRYAMSAIAADAQMAGYWGSYYAAPGTGGTMDPCSTTQADIQADTLEHVQGYDDTAGTFPTCIANRKSGTDVLVIRRAEPDSSDVETGGFVDWAKVKAGQYYIQTGLNSSTQLRYLIGPGLGTQSANSSYFTLTQKDTTKPGTLRKMYVHIYYISTCSVPTGSGGACKSTDDGGTPIPTLKRAELSVSGGAAAFTTSTIAEGIENLQVDYGQDTDGDGLPDTYANASAITTTAGWASVMTARVYLLARAGESTPGYSDAGRTYALGSYGSTSAPASEQAFRRHVFTQTVRFVNPAGRLTQ